jgi:GntR family transcriptional repressor for pyruvate dehydrogenase complex
MLDETQSRTSENLYANFRIRRERLYQQVAQSIEELIDSGRLRPGDQLPSERELASGLGVGRGVIREGIKVLQERGLVSIKPGEGIFVAEIHTDVVTNQLDRFLRMGSTSNDDLGEVRRILEIEIAGLAAQRAEADDLQSMKQAIEAMEDNILSQEAFIAADHAFHLALARATRNELLPLLMGVIVDRLQETRNLVFRVHGAPERGQVWHRAIYAAIETGNVEAAKESMSMHLDQVEEDSKAGKLVSAKGY